MNRVINLKHLGKKVLIHYNHICRVAQEQYHWTWKLLIKKIK